MAFFIVVAVKFVFTLFTAMALNTLISTVCAASALEVVLARIIDALWLMRRLCFAFHL